MVADQLRRSPDDLSYLGDLDEGLDLDPGFGEPPVRAPVVGSPEVAKPVLVASRPVPRPRPLLALFPPPSMPVSVAPQSMPPAAALPASVGAAAVATAGPRHTPPPSVPVEPDALTYEAFYGLREEPFGVALDTKFLYRSAACDRAAEELLVSIARRDGLAVLTGDAGMGKTLLCRALLERIDRRTFTSFVADPFVTLEDLLKAILFDFGVISRTDLGSRRLAGATRHELTFALHEFLLSLVQINGFAVVFIDDAQRVSPEMLSEVQDIADTDQALMGIVLIGQPELLLKVGHRQLASGADRIPVRVRLEPLAEDEIPSYVLHRLAIVGAGRLSVEFDDAALALIYKISRGAPQRVNLLCDRALTRGFGDSVKVIDGRLVEAAARDLDFLAPAPVTRRVMKWVLTSLALIGLIFLGAAIGSFVFREQLTRRVAQWAPAPPAAPAMNLASPLETAPPPVDGPTTSRGGR